MNLGKGVTCPDRLATDCQNLHENASVRGISNQFMVAKRICIKNKYALIKYIIIAEAQKAGAVNQTQSEATLGAADELCRAKERITKMRRRRRRRIGEW